MPAYERLEQSFTIASGDHAAGRRASTSFTRFRLAGSTANKRIVSLQPRIEWGSFLSGHRREVAIGIGVRPRPGVT